MVDSVCEYLKSKNLSPYISNLDLTCLEFGSIDYENNSSEYSDQAYCVVKYQKKDEPYNFMFNVIRDRKSRKVTAELLFMCKDIIITPQLYFDAIPHLAASYPKAHSILNKEHNFIFITTEDLGSGRLLQQWNFHAPNEKYIVPVLLRPSIIGGTDITTQHGPNLDDHVSMTNSLRDTALNPRKVYDSKYGNIPKKLHR